MRSRPRVNLAVIQSSIMLIAFTLGGCRGDKPEKHSIARTPADSAQQQSVAKDRKAAPIPSTPAPETPPQEPCSRPGYHFSPQEDLEQIDSELLLSARTEIEMTAYSFTDPEIAGALEDRARNGVEIKMYRDRSSTKEELSRKEPSEPLIVALARTPNIQVRVKGSSTLAHMKAYEIDGRTLRTGSANFSANAEKKQDNDLLVTCDGKTIELFRAKFQEMWDRPDNELIQ